MANWLPRLPLLALFLLLAAGPAAAQDAMVLPAPTPEEICTLSSSDIDTHHHVTSALPAGTGPFATPSPSSTFEVTFVEGGCGAWPQEAIDAVTFATEIWGHHLASEIPIHVEATWDASLPSGTLGSAGPRAIISDASLPQGAGRPNTWYPIAQASAMAETDFAAQFDLDMDIRMRLNCNRDDWYFETDAAPPGGTIDFVTVVLHELGHGIGFVGTMSKEDDVEEAGWGRPTNAGDVLPLAYDVVAEDAAATRLIDETVYPNPSEALFDVLRSDAVFVGGTEARAAYGDERPPLFAPSTWQPGSSFSHLDTDAFTGTENALMRHQIDRASAVHSPGPVFCGMLADMAWPLGSSCDELLGTSPSPALALSPTSLDVGVVTEGTAATAALTLENTSDDVTVTGDITVDGDDFSGVSGTGAFSLAPGATRTIQVRFAPTAPETRRGMVIVSHDAGVPDSPLTADLVGEGRAAPTIVNPIDDQALTLGGDVISIDLDNVFESPEGDALTYAVEANPTQRLTLTLDAAQLTVAAAQTGTATVTATATDEAGATANAVFAVSVDDFVVTVQRSFADATDAANYRLVALPGAVDLDIAQTLPGTTPGTTWRAFRDTGIDDPEDYLEEYRPNAADFRFQPGRGFWLLSTVDWTFDAVLDAVQPDPDGDVHVPLHPGWNIISNPTSLDLAWAEVLAHNAIDERLWRWADGAWADLTADTLRSARAAGEAFYFFNAGGANALETLRLPTAPSEAAERQASALPEVPTFTLTLTQAGQPVSRVRLGQAATAQTYAAPPAAFGSARLALRAERPLAGRLYASLQDRAVDLTVTAAPGTDLTLTAAALPAVLGSQEAILLEPSTGRRHDLRRTAEVPLRITTEETPLRLLIGSPAFIDDAVPPPPTLRLSRLYPNPSAGAVTIEFSLPEALPTQLEVFDVLGRQVARLHEGELGPGTHSLTWEGLLPHGSPAASGVYLVRLHAGGETRTKRLTRLP
ncbi:MAG: T9SS type A sorting domain-containing protein [Bacteroidetes bacterium]|jgi:hypothetical protein|nr:T9SS type A sorting domain-containing protein [Bacteroidota bacterium]